MATVTATMESSQTLIQSESRVQRSYEVSEQRQVKKKKSTRRHKEEGSISVSKSTDKLHKKMKATEETNPQCSKCSRAVYAMERVKAEKRVWHKECFRCDTCNKQLTVETYQSDHTTLYCKPHFKQLFEPKPVDGDDETDAAPKKHQMIICESNPVELPPDVVRASDKPDLGLEELAQLDVKSRFEVFENRKPEEPQPLQPRAPREKSTALLSKLAKFKAKGMDVGVSDEYLNGVPIEESSSEPEDDEDEDSVLKNSYKLAKTASKEQPPPFCNMSEIVGRFEAGQHATSDRHRERKQEIQNIRSRLFMGKQAKIKEMYEQSVLQSEQGITSSEKIARDLDLDSEKSRAIKERFETGEVFNDENLPPRNREIDDQSLFNEDSGDTLRKFILPKVRSVDPTSPTSDPRICKLTEEPNTGIGKKSRSIFLELDANSKGSGPLSPPPQEAPRRKEIPFIPKDVVRAADRVEDVKIETADISDKFKFFETYKPETVRKEFRMTPPRQVQRPKSPSPEPYHEPSVVRSSSVQQDSLPPHAATRMIHVFTHLQHNAKQDNGPKPLKCFTPPPPGEYEKHANTSSEEDYSEEESEDERRVCDPREDEALKQAQQLARTKSFRDRFEKWSDSEPQRSPSAIVIERQPSEDDGESQLETAKSLREKFENMKVQQSNAKAFVPKVNRFV